MTEPTSLSSLRTAVLLPCYNEATTIGSVVTGFRTALPNAAIYVYNNNSTDATAEMAARAGAIVRKEPRQGKGAVLRRMFADVEADIYIMADGDATYAPDSVHTFTARLIEENLDMVVGARVDTTGQAYPAGHRLGNWMLSGLVRLIFGNRVRDMLSGYRAFSRRFVKSFPATATGFEIETELTVYALQQNIPIAEINTPYSPRPAESASKLSTFSDGFRILRMILLLIRDEKPLQFFTIAAVISAALSLILAAPILSEYAETGLVPRFPTAFLSMGIGLLGLMFLNTGLILDAIARVRYERRRSVYLSFASPQSRLSQVAPKHMGAN